MEVSARILFHISDTRSSTTRKRLKRQDSPGMATASRGLSSGFGKAMVSWKVRSRCFCSAWALDRISICGALYGNEQTSLIRIVSRTVSCSLCPPVSVAADTISRRASSTFWRTE